MESIKDISKTQWFMIISIIAFIVMFIFRQQIWDSKLGQAKKDIFNTIITDEPEEAQENIKNINCSFNLKQYICPDEQ